MEHDNPERGAACQPRPLAQAAVGQVLVCEHCRQMHLQVGPLTLRLTPEAFGDLAGLVLSAQRALAPVLPAEAGVAEAAASAVWH